MEYSYPANYSIQTIDHNSENIAEIRTVLRELYVSRTLTMIQVINLAFSLVSIVGIYATVALDRITIASSD